MRHGAAVDLLFPWEGLASERSHVEQHDSPLGSHSCRYLCSFSLSHALILPLLTSFAFDPCIPQLLPPSFSSQFSSVSSPWPFARILRQIGIWNQPFFISSGLCLSLIVVLPSSYCMSSLSPQLSSLVFCALLYYSYLTLFPVFSLLLFDAVCPSVLFSISCFLKFPLVSLSSIFHNNSKYLSDMHKAGCVCLPLSQKINWRIALLNNPHPPLCISFFIIPLFILMSYVLMKTTKTVIMLSRSIVFLSLDCAFCESICS